MIFMQDCVWGTQAIFYKQKIHDHILVMQEKRGKKRTIMLLA